MSDHLSMWKRLAVALLVVVIAGCGKSASPDAAANKETGEASPAAAGDPTKKKIIPIQKDVRQLEGNWVMLVTVEGHDKYLWILRILKDAGGKHLAEMIDTTNDDLEPKIEAIEVDGKAVRLQIKNKNSTFDFQGNFDGVAIRGTVGNGPQVMYLARMLSTSETKLADYASSALPPATDVFGKAIEAMQNVPQPKVILQLARENRNSPVSLEAVFGMLNMQVQAGFDDETLRSIIDLYLELAQVWGRRIHAQAEMLSAKQLVLTARLPQEALKHLDQAEKMLGENAAAKSQIQSLREQAEIQVSLAKSRSKVDEERAAAHVELQAALKKQPYNAEILLALAEYSAAMKQRPAAIEYYSALVALPMLEHLILARRAGQPAGEPTVTEVLKKLWTEEHGNPDAMEEHLYKLKAERLAALQEEIRKQTPPVAADAGDHVVLVELFTGAQSPSAVATEVAVDALRETYPMSEVVTLRYHQHIPGPDGLVNQDSEDRFAFYELARTPTLAVDGALLNPEQVPYGGYLQSAGTAYAIARLVVDQRLKQKTPIRLDLSARIENGDLSIQAGVTGASDEELPSLRLRLAIVEESVDAAVPIGIRHHAMVVREMPGGARGILPKKGELKFEFTMPATDLQAHLDDYLSRYEAGNRIEIPASVKPPVRGPLYLVGWVQNDKVNTEHPEVGRAVLQTAIVPVQGTLPAASPAAKPATTPETKSDTRPAPGGPPAPALPE